jgi:hypothetical protein
MASLSCRGLECGDAAETAGVLPDLHRGGACGEPARRGQSGVVGNAVDAVAGDDVVGRVGLIEAIFGHRAPPLRVRFRTEKRLLDGELRRFAYRKRVWKRCRLPFCLGAGFERGGFGVHFVGNSDEPVRLRLIGQLLGKAAAVSGQLPQADGGIGPCPIAACRWRHVSTNVSTRRLPPCRRERAFDLRGVCMSAVKVKGSQQYGDHHRR